MNTKQQLSLAQSIEQIDSPEANRIKQPIEGTWYTVQGSHLPGELDAERLGRTDRNAQPRRLKFDRKRTGGRWRGVRSSLGAIVARIERFVGAIDLVGRFVGAILVEGDDKVGVALQRVAEDHLIYWSHFGLSEPFWLWTKSNHIVKSNQIKSHFLV